MGSCKSVPCVDDCCDHSTLTIYGMASAVYGPWMVRQGDYLIATADLVHEFDGGVLDVDVFTKSMTDTGNGTNVDSTVKISATIAGRRVAAEWGPHTGIGLRELVRFRFKNRTNANSSWVMFRMLRSVWFDAVRT